MDWQSTQKIKDLKKPYIRSKCDRQGPEQELLFIESPKVVNCCQKNSKKYHFCIFLNNFMEFIKDIFYKSLIESL